VARLFIAVWPPPSVVELLRALPRDEAPGLRWTTPEQWHATLRYFGDVDEVAAVAAFEMVEAEAAIAVVGPTVERLDAGVIVAPIVGLDALAGAVHARTAGLGEPPHPAGFRGHLTLARQRVEAPCSADGVSLHDSFAVTEIALVRSSLHAAGARYVTLARRPLST